MASRTQDSAVGIRYCSQCPDFPSLLSSWAGGRPGCVSDAQTTFVNHIPSFSVSLLAIKLFRSYSLPPFPLGLYLPFPYLENFSQIQVLFGSGMSCSGAQGRKERSPEILWSLMASKSCFQGFGFACCKQEEAGGWKELWLCRDGPVCAAFDAGCVCSVPAAGAAPPAAPCVSLGHARQD